MTVLPVAQLVHVSVAGVTAWLSLLLVAVQQHIAQSHLLVHSFVLQVVRCSVQRILDTRTFLAVLF